MADAEHAVQGSSPLAATLDVLLTATSSSFLFGEVPERLATDPVTVDEVLTVIDARIRRRLEASDHPVYRSLAEQIEKFRKLAITRAEDSVES